MGLAIGLFAASFGAYALGVFHVSGGVIWIPFHAAILGMLVACGVGLRGDGAAFAWLVTYASLLGYRADHAFLGLSSRSVPERLAYFAGLEGLVVLAIEGIVLGSIAFALGALVRWGFDSLRRATALTSSNEG